MTQELYDKLKGELGAVDLGHPQFDPEYHRKIWDLKNITVLICQRKTKIFTQLCVESLLRFYPDIQILVVDGDSQDDSTLYLRYKSITTPNLKVYERFGKSHSHGFTLDDAITNYIKTEYVLTMDSDTITNRGGWVEQLLDQFRDNKNLYATGSLMIVSYSNYGCGAPEDEKDILRYAHPSCSIFHVPTYLKLKVSFNDNGSPLAHNLIAAQKAGYEIGAFPIDKYVSHRMGVSWVKEHQIIWNDDYDVFIRPFVTFIITLPEHITQLENQTDHDFNVNVKDQMQSVRIWNEGTKDIANRYYGMRNMVNGEYVCLLSEHVHEIDTWLVHSLKLAVIEQKAPEQLIVKDIPFFKRKFWQSTEALT